MFFLNLSLFLLILFQHCGFDKFVRLLRSVHSYRMNFRRNSSLLLKVGGIFYESQSIYSIGYSYTALKHHHTRCIFARRVAGRNFSNCILRTTLDFTGRATALHRYPCYVTTTSSEQMKAS